MFGNILRKVSQITKVYWVTKIENGVVQNKNFSTYPIPTFLDTGHLYPLYAEIEDSNGPFGAKGLGERTTAGPAAAILNAVHEATGIRFFKLPLTPEKVLRGIKTNTEKN